MFRSALLKLTGLYLLILMLVSLFFSVNLYRISSQEVNNHLRRQAAFLNSSPPTGTPPGDFSILPFEQERQRELTNSNQHVMAQLVYANIVILILGGIGSYLLARRTIRPIEEAHAAQARFTADASHELRTPIAVMRAETEVALRDPKLNIKDARELLQSNVEELERLTALSEGLLQLARSTGDVAMDEKVLIASVVETAVSQVSHSAKTKHLTIQTKQIPNVTIAGNQTQLTQLLVILLDNALKYSPSKHDITLSGKLDHNQLRLSVTDQGYGIAAADLAHVFERFYRADTARSKANVTGHGLGLSIAEQIVGTHQGTIEATSTPGKGSVFTIILPVSKAS